MEEKIKEIVAKFTNEDGTVDKEGLAKEVAQDTQNVIGNIVSQERKKVQNSAKKSSENSSNEPETENIEDPEQKNTTDFSNADIQNLINSMNELKKEVVGIKSEKSASDFKNKAKIAGLDESIINAFVNSGAKLDKIDLSSISNETIPDYSSETANVVPEEDDDEKNEDIVSKARKLMGLDK